ncbi:MAG: hypothetical protein AB7H96_18220 [Vicinamibacterales bacterium]
MRRSVVSILLVVFSFCLWPTRAEAFFWDWLDDLSGPSFKGVTFNWRIWCLSDTKVQEQVVIIHRIEIGRSVEALLNRLRPIAAQPLSSGGRLAVAAAELADTAVSTANRAVDVQRAGRDALGLVRLSIAQRDLAETMTRRAESVGQQNLPLDVADQQLMAAATEQVSGPHTESVNVGITVSLCSNDPERNTRGYLSANVGWGYNTQPLYRIDSTRLVTLGLSYHAVAARFLTVGTGGGVAIFSSNQLQTFSKPYIEPYIVDFKPFLIPWKKKASSTATTDVPPPSWWKETISFRYSTLMFPTGFEPGRFRRWTDLDSKVVAPSPRFPAELIHSVGVHVDLEPIMKRLIKASKSRAGDS